MYQEIRCPKCKAKVKKTKNTVSCSRKHTYPIKGNVLGLWEMDMESNKKSIKVINEELEFTKTIKRNQDESSNAFKEAQEFLTRDKKSTYGAKRVVDKELETMKKLLPPLEDIKILNIGAGYGNEAEYFKNWGANDIVLTDISSEFLKTAAKRVSPRYSFAANAENLPLANKSFDIAIFGSALHHVPHPMKALKEAARVSHAVAAFGEPHDMRWMKHILNRMNWNTEYGDLDTHRFSVDNVMNALKRMGLNTTHTTNFIWFPLTKVKNLSNNKLFVDGYFLFLRLLDATLGTIGHNLTFYAVSRNAPEKLK